MSFQLLIASVNKDEKNLLATMKVSSNAVLVNQCDRDEVENYDFAGKNIKIIRQSERGVGLSRNTALNNSDADICLFSDEDIIYDENYEKKVMDAFNRLPDASVITFNIDVDERRRTYINENEHQVKWYNYGRYPAYAIAVRRIDIVRCGIEYSLLFGGGAKYSNGEDSLFLHDCLKNKLKIYAVTDKLGHEEYRESTWFKGYTEKFFFDRGVLYHFLYGKMAAVFGLRFLFNNRHKMFKDIGFARAFTLLKQGINEGKTL